MQKDEQDSDVCIGDVYVGRVQHVVDNIRAAFVELRPGTRGYLPLSGMAPKEIKAEQEILVQVKRPAKGTKDAVLTTDIELVGRYVLLREDSTGPVHISRKIRDEAHLDRLHTLAEGLTGEEKETGRMPAVTIRTNATEAPDAWITEEYDRLMKLWQHIHEHGGQRKLYSRLYTDLPFYLQHINAYPADRIDRIVTDQEDLYEELRHALPGMTVEKYEDPSYPPDARYRLSVAAKKASERLIWLKSGANLVIDRTEAMTVIDVNSAKAVDGKRASESTFFKINMEAADEVARQLRLRNLSGIILVDFIDMKKKEHTDALIARIRDRLKEDPVKAVFVDVTGLGIVELTRAKRFS